MQYWRDYGWSDEDIKHQWSLWFVNRDDDCNIVRSTRKGNTRFFKAVSDKAVKQRLIADRRTYRELICGCKAFADHRPLCPMRRPSRSPNYGETPWVWSHGDGLGRDVDPTCNPESACLTEADYAPLEEIHVLECEYEWEQFDYHHLLK